MHDQDKTHSADIFIERYMPGASKEARNDARENVTRLVAVLVRVNDRLKREELAMSDSPDSESCDRVGMIGA